MEDAKQQKMGGRSAKSVTKKRNKEQPGKRVKTQTKNVMKTEDGEKEIQEIMINAKQRN